MNKHTPGPWKWDESWGAIVVDRPDMQKLICPMWTGCDRARMGRDVVDEDLANARLIAAAPDLLRYAQIVEEWESCRTKESQYDFTKRHGVENVRNVDLWLSYLRKDVIGKATAK